MWHKLLKCLGEQKYAPLYIYINFNLKIMMNCCFQKVKKCILTLGNSLEVHVRHKVPLR